MRFYRQITAEYTCSKRCGYHHSVVGASLSPFHLICAAIAALPLWLVSLFEPWEFPWYCLVNILAGELLLLFLSGFVSGLVLTPFTSAGTTLCRACGAPMFLAGRHFDPLGSAKPHWSDWVISAVFVAVNLVFWGALLTGRL